MAGIGDALENFREKGREFKKRKGGVKGSKEPTRNKPTNSKPTNNKPTNTKPTNTKPTNNKPTRNNKPTHTGSRKEGEDEAHNEEELDQKFYFTRRDQQIEEELTATLFSELRDDTPDTPSRKKHKKNDSFRDTKYKKEDEEIVGAFGYEDDMKKEEGEEEEEELKRMYTLHFF